MKTFLIGCTALMYMGVTFGPTPFIHAYAQDAEVAVVADPAPVVVAVPVVPSATPVVVVPDDSKSEVKSIEDVGEAVGAVVKAVEAGKAGQWGLVVSIVVALIVFLFRKWFLKLIKTREALKWVSFSLSILAFYGTALGMGMEWWPALLDTLIYGLPVALGSIGVWEVAKGKLPTPKDKVDVPVPVEGSG